MDNQSWSGVLTIDNCQDVARRIFEFLNGRRYTFVSTSDLDEWRPQVRTGQQIERGWPERPGSEYSAWAEAGKYAGFNFSDTYGVWGCSTTAANDTLDPTYNNPYISIDEWPHYGQVFIAHRAGMGNLIYWVIAPEIERHE